MHRKELAKATDVRTAPMRAQIEFADGRISLPAQTAYEREQLVEHVLACTRSKGQLRVHVDRRRWTVERADRWHPAVCSVCERRIDQAVCRRHRGTTTAYCLSCAMKRPLLTINLLSRLPARVVLRDVQAHYAYGRTLVPW